MPAEGEGEGDAGAPDAGAPDAGAPDAGAPDGGEADAGPPPCPGPPPAGPVCDSDDSDLRLCFDFSSAQVSNGNLGRVNDQSSYANHGYAEESAALEEGRGGEVLRTGTALGWLRINEHASLELETFTAQAWVLLESFETPGSRHMVFDDNGEWGMSVRPDGSLVCACNLRDLPGANARSAPGLVSLDTWTQVTCRYDGTRLAAFVDGVEVASDEAAGVVNTDNGDFLAVGADSPSGGDIYNGLLDDVRLFAGARSDAALCWDAQP